MWILEARISFAILFPFVKEEICTLCVVEVSGTNTAAGSRSMKQNLDTGVEVYDNKVKKEQRHTATQQTRNQICI